MARLAVCTITWWNQSDRYEVFFNRDELKSRQPALPPATSLQAGTQYLAPTDPEAGGTWLLVNEKGLTLALLNLYEEESAGSPDQGPWRSRGLLLRELAACPNLSSLSRRLQSLGAGHYNAFTLIAFQSAPHFAIALWENRPHRRPSLTGPDSHPSRPVSSSSCSTAGVIAERRQIFQSMTANRLVSPLLLRQFHHFDNHGHPSSHTVLMNRPDAQTWSYSHIQVDSCRTTFYHEAFPRHLQGAIHAFAATLPRAR